MSVWSDSVDPGNMKKFEYELKGSKKNRVKGNLTNNGNGTFSGALDLSTVLSRSTSWIWRVKLEDKNKNKFHVEASVSVD